MSYGTISILTPDGPDAADAEVEVVDLGLGPAFNVSDPTGFQAFNATGRDGSYAHVFEGCPVDGPPTTWSTLSFDADAPVDSSIEIFVRVAEGRTELAEAEWILVGDLGDLETPVDLGELLPGGAHGRFLEARAELHRDVPDRQPTLRRLGVGFACSG